MPKEIIFVKLGGSLITEKRATESFRASVVERTSQELARAMTFLSTTNLVIGHGGGSYGHTFAEKYDTFNGVNTRDEWFGFAKVALSVRNLNTLVVSSLIDAGIPAFSIQPSATAQSHNKTLKHFDTTNIERALAQDLVPVIHGDVSFDEGIGGTIISTENIFYYLAKELRPRKIYLFGETEGVYDNNKDTIPEINQSNLALYRNMLKGSEGVDVTGGMLSKVLTMLELVRELPDLQIWISGGNMPGQIAQSITGERQFGTLIRHKVTE